MQKVSSLQRQHRKHGPLANTSVSFTEPTRLFAPVVTPSSPLSPHERQEHPGHVAQFRHSFDRLSIRPPVPDGGAGNEVEQSEGQSDMQQTEKQLSSVQRKEAERQPTPQKGEPLQEAANISQVQENHTGLPDTLKAGVESLSGLAMDDVRVHYNSAKPAQVDALAYTQGTEIHVGTGQEQHLAHEAWHVVQQMQGRVKPTLQMKGVAINDDLGLEKEADVMGMEASRTSVLAQPNVAHKQEEVHSKAQQQRNIQSIQLMPRTGQGSVSIEVIQQSSENRCWAAVGRSIHNYYEGEDHNSEREFVENMNSALLSNYDNDRVADIDNILGSGSTRNHLAGSDSDRDNFLQRFITREINQGRPIIANVNNNHYVIIHGYEINDTDYKVWLMDPGTGTSTLVDTVKTNGCIQWVGEYALSVLYYTS